MLSHDRVWAAIDTLAKINGMSPSGLARRAGLDPTTFNRSKRVAGDGRPRWPSTESISKVLEATGTAIGDFVMLMTPPGPERGFHGSELGATMLHSPSNSQGFGEDGLSTSRRGDEMPFPGCRDEGVFALEVCGNALLPHYRDGDTIIISPNTPIRRGDRVVVRMLDGDVAPWVLHQRTAGTVELRPIGHERTKRIVPVEEIDWISRITWASQ